MARARLIHDASFAAAARAVELFPYLRPEERAEAFAALYDIVSAAIESFDIMREREEIRVRPSQN